MTTPLRPLSNFAEVQAGLPVSPVDSRDAGGGALVFAVMPSSLKSDGAFEPDRELLVPSISATTSDARYRIAPGDILLTAKSTETSLRCGLVTSKGKLNPAPCFASSLIRIRIESPGDLLPRFLHAWLTSPGGRGALLAESQSATSQLNLTTSAISQLRIPVPDVAQQRRIVEFLDTAQVAHDSAIAAAETRLALARSVAFLNL